VTKRPAAAFVLSIPPVSLGRGGDRAATPVSEREEVGLARRLVSARTRPEDERYALAQVAAKVAAVAASSREGRRAVVPTGSLGRCGCEKMEKKRKETEMACQMDLGQKEDTNSKYFSKV
jgi:hypothetical protein